MTADEIIRSFTNALLDRRDEETKNIYVELNRTLRYVHDLENKVSGLQAQFDNVEATKGLLTDD